MKEIKKNIKEKQFHKVYLLTGDEGYLILQARQMLKQALVRDGDDMNYTVFEESKIDLSALADLAMTYPFFSEKRVIHLNQTNIIKTGKDEFLKILQNLPETTCLIITEFGKVDSRTKVYKWIKSNGYIGEFLKKNQKEKTLITFLARILAKDKKQIREADARYFLRLVGDDLFRIRNEAEKISAYLGEESIVTREIIDLVVDSQIENKIFDMIQAIAMKNRFEALRLYNDLIILKEEPISILSLLVKRYRILNVLKSMYGQRKPAGEMAKAAGVPAYYLDQYTSQLQYYTKEQLSDCLSSALDMEADIKMGRIDKQIGVEMLIIRMMED